MELVNNFISMEALKEFYFLFEFALILFSIKIAGHLSAKIGQPTVFGKLLAGIIMGPSLLNILQTSPLIKEVAEIGVILLMFLAGVETDLKEFRKSIAGAAYVAVGGVILPFLAGVWLAMVYGFDSSTAYFIGVLLVATSVSISVQTLRELGKLKSKEGITILGGAVIDDILGLVFLSVVLGMVSAEGNTASPGIVGTLLILFIKIILFFILAFLTGKFLLPKIIKWAGKMQVSQPLLTFVIAIALLYGFLAEFFGLATIVGAYLVGLMLSMTEFQHQIYGSVEKAGYSFFIPVFFINIGLAANVREIGADLLFFILLLTFAAIVTKIIGCGVGAKLAHFNWKSSMGIGAGMVARGEVGLIVASLGLERGIIDGQIFTGMVFIALATTLVTPPMLKAIFK